MSQQAVAELFEKIQADTSLQAELQVVTDAQLPAKLVAVGEKHGHQFSEADVQQMMAAPPDEELSDEALEAEAGGLSFDFQPTTGFFNIGVNTRFCTTGTHIGGDDGLMLRKSGGEKIEL